MTICANPECGKEFKVSTSDGRSKRRIYCSKSCCSRTANLKSFGYRQKTTEQLKLLEKLAKKQQNFHVIFPLKDKCEVCDSKEKLQFHEISYQPLEYITLCRSCHSILHLRFFKGKVKPEIGRL